MKTEQKMKWITTGAVLLMTAGAAQANVLSYTNSVALPNDTNTALSLSRFDSSLGTLTGVNIQLTTTISGATVSMDNDSSLAQNGTARVQNLVNSLSSTVGLLRTDFSSISGTDLQLNQSQVFNLAATTGDTVGQFDATMLGDYGTWAPGDLTATGSGDIASAVWGGYTGAGNFAITLNATYTTSATFDGSDGYFQGNTPNGTFDGIVSYTYAAIPEPASIAMIGLAGAAAIFIRRIFMM